MIRDSETSSEKMGECCPPGSIGEAPQQNEGTRGVEKATENGLNYYEVGEGKDVIVLMTDVFGWESGRHRIICDELADSGFHVFMPDYFHGSPAAYVPKGPFKMFTFLPEMARVALQAPLMIYKIRSRFSAANVVQRDIVEDMLPTIKEQLGNDVKLACFGFCFGGWVIGKACATGEFACGVSCHPSFQPEIIFGGSEEAVARAVGQDVPILLMPAGNDSGKLKPGGKCMEILGAKSESVPFPTMIHGWVTRGDRSKPKIREAQDEAIGRVKLFVANVFSSI